ncbi:hypothetical protein IP91_02596 [Pseudoduganella lurida]|uniref:Uncharacterized protein n=1 Tax=Pseudoduganella lurida TaxID=1036180 RepID=A0A562R7Z0_9BURK|nr:hypothetical protein [Pseudoduganella lurida]TWI65189.1 hypothetical protein IP91_02596 [Pseudoduganella lurida]
MQQQQIGRGAVVDFDTQEGPQRGTVTNLFEDITHQRTLAEIRVPNTLNGMPWLMKLTDLRLAKPIQDAITPVQTSAQAS